MRKKSTIICPEIEEIIELINLLPEEAESLFDQICDQRIIKKDRTGFIVSDSAKDLLPAKIVEYIFDREPVTKSVERFNDLIKAKNLFRHFAELNKKFPDWKNIGLHFFTVDYQSRQFPIFLGFSDEGFIKPVQSELIELFEKYDIPFFRIRECPDCEKIFWAKRTDAKACSKPCSERISSRVYEARNRDEINKKRREVYAETKEREEKRLRRRLQNYANNISFRR